MFTVRLPLVLTQVHLVGKLKERALGRFPNIVHVHDLPDPYPAIERLQSLSSRQPRLTQLATMAHIFARPLHPTLNFLELQKQAKECAKLLRDVNILVYFIVGVSVCGLQEISILFKLKSLLNPKLKKNIYFFYCKKKYKSKTNNRLKTQQG